MLVLFCVRLGDGGVSVISPHFCNVLYNIDMTFHNPVASQGSGNIIPAFRQGLAVASRSQPEDSHLGPLASLHDTESREGTLALRGGWSTVCETET